MTYVAIVAFRSAVWSLALFACAPVHQSAANGGAVGAPSPVVGGSASCPESQQPTYFEAAMLAEHVPVSSEKYADTREAIPGTPYTILLLDPKTRTLSSAPPPSQSRREGAIVPLPGGRALLIGGEGEGSDDVLLYEGKTGWSKALHIEHSPIGPTAVPLPSGDILVSGGVIRDGGVLDRAFLIRTSDMTVSPAGAMKSKRLWHAMVALPDGKVLVIGGSGKNGPEDASTEVFDPATQQFTVGELLPLALSHPHAAVSPSGGIVVAGEEGVVYRPPGQAWMVLSTAHNPSRRVVVFADCVALVTSDVAVEAWDLTSRRLLQTLRPIVSRGPTSELVRIDDRTALLAGGQDANTGTSAEVYVRVTSPPKKSSFEWRAVSPYEIRAERVPASIAFESSEGIVTIQQEGPAKISFVTGGAEVAIGATLTAVGARVLKAGGTTAYEGEDEVDRRSPAQSAAETGLIDIETGAWSRTGQPRSRSNHVAVTLRKGTVALFGGEDGRRGVREVEGWDEVSRRFRGMGALVHPRVGHTATVLSDGGVLVTGHCNVSLEGNGAPVFRDPVAAITSEHWREGGKVVVSRLTVERCFHAAALLLDGRVLVAGGFAADDKTAANHGEPSIYLSDPRKSAEIWDPATGKWSSLPDMNEPRGHIAAATLPDGRVLVAGGLEGVYAGDVPATVEAYDPRANTWTVLGRLPRPIFTPPSLAILGPERVLLRTQDEMYELKIAPSASR